MLMPLMFHGGSSPELYDDYGRPETGGCCCPRVVRFLLENHLCIVFHIAVFLVKTKLSRIRSSLTFFGC